MKFYNGQRVRIDDHPGEHITVVLNDPDKLGHIVCDSSQVGYFSIHEDAVERAPVLHGLLHYHVDWDATEVEGEPYIEISSSTLCDSSIDCDRDHAVIAIEKNHVVDDAPTVIPQDPSAPNRCATCNATWEWDREWHELSCTREDLTAVDAVAVPHCAECGFRWPVASETRRHSIQCSKYYNPVKR